MDPLEEDEIVQIEAPTILSEYRDFKNQKITVKYDDPWFISSTVSLKVSNTWLLVSIGSQ